MVAASLRYPCGTLAASAAYVLAADAGCKGAVNGKHIRIKKPARSGNVYYNYKGFFSIILMGVANGNYEFIYCNCEAEGSIGEAGYWKACDLQKALGEGRCHLPQCVRIRGDKSITPHLIGDNAFPIGVNLLKPFPHRQLTLEECIFNYHLSRARRIIENVFGIISSRFMVLQMEMHFVPDHCINIVSAICVLRNILRKRCGNVYVPPGTCDKEDINYNIIDGNWHAVPSLKTNTTQPQHVHKTSKKRHWL